MPRFIYFGIVLASLFWLVPIAANADDDAAMPLASAVRNEPPWNPYLAASPWPMSHRNPYNQASSPHAGPTARGEARPNFLEGNPVPVTLAMSGTYPNGQQVVWGVTTKDIFKLDTTGSRIGFMAREARLQDKEDAISGAYSLIDADGTFFVPHGRRLEAYRDAIKDDPTSKIQLWKTYELPERVGNRSDVKTGESPDKIVGINLTYDGRLILLTESGLLVSLSRQLDDPVYLSLETDEPISNSLAIDETGGIFVVTSDAVVRVQWDPKGKLKRKELNRNAEGTTSSDQRLSLAWQVPYQSSTEQFPGRLGVGSGTTPSLVGVGDQDKFVVIGDGQRQMHLVLIWRGDIPDDWTGIPGRDRRIAAELPVTFGHKGSERSTTEQSLTVRGYEIVAVSNLYGDMPALQPRFAKRVFGNKHFRTIYRSNYERVAPHGVEKFGWNPNTRKLASIWANPEMSVPNGIPTMSEATGLLYCVGQRESDWTLEAINWATGKSEFHQRLGRNFRFNSFYSATEIGPGGTIINGMYGGIIRFSSGGTGSTVSTSK